MVVSKKSSTFAPSNKNKQQFKIITIMTKEELAQKIAQGEYTNCQRDNKYSASFKIDGAKASVTKIGNNFVAMTVISTCISEEDYNKILKQALEIELESAYEKVREITGRIKEL